MMADEPSETSNHAPTASRSVDAAQLVAAHAMSVYRYAFRLCGSAADAEDLTQQTFLLACKSRDQLREPEKALSWLFAIVRTTFLKGRRRLRPLAAADCELEMEAFAGPMPDADTIDHESLQRALNALPDEQKLILMLFYFEERSYKEIAEELDLPIGTVMSRLSRAKERLRRELAPTQGEVKLSSPAERPRSADSSDGGAGTAFLAFRLR